MQPQEFRSYKGEKEAEVQVQMKEDNNKVQSIVNHLEQMKRQDPIDGDRTIQKESNVMKLAKGFDSNVNGTNCGISNDARIALKFGTNPLEKMMIDRRKRNNEEENVTARIWKTLKKTPMKAKKKTPLKKTPKTKGQEKKMPQR